MMTRFLFAAGGFAAGVALALIVAAVTHRGTVERLETAQRELAEARAAVETERDETSRWLALVEAQAQRDIERERADGLKRGEQAAEPASDVEHQVDWTAKLQHERDRANRLESQLADAMAENARAEKARAEKARAEKATRAGDAPPGKGGGGLAPLDGGGKAAKAGPAKSALLGPPAALDPNRPYAPPAWWTRQQTKDGKTSDLIVPPRGRFAE